MKVYINQLNIDLAHEFAGVFEPYFQNKTTYTEVFTDEGWYHIDSNKVHKVEVLDKEIVSYPEFYKNVTLLADYSTCTKQRTYSVCGRHHGQQFVSNYLYRMPTHTHVQLVIQFCNEAPEIPRDIYFEVLEQTKKAKATSIDQQLVMKRDIDDLFVKNELIEFLSHLF